MNKIKEFFSKKLIKKLIITTISIVFVVCLFFYEMVRENNYLKKAAPLLDSFHFYFDNEYIETKGSWDIHDTEGGQYRYPRLSNIRCFIKSGYCEETYVEEFAVWFIDHYLYDITSIKNGIITAQRETDYIITELTLNTNTKEVTSRQLPKGKKDSTFDVGNRTVYKKLTDGYLLTTQIKQKEINAFDTPVLYLVRLARREK